jgi:hypothetical protein
LLPQPVAYATPSSSISAERDYSMVNWDVDDATVYRIVQENLGDFETYVGYILDFQTDSEEE